MTEIVYDARALIDGVDDLRMDRRVRTATSIDHLTWHRRWQSTSDCCTRSFETIVGYQHSSTRGVERRRFITQNLAHHHVRVGGSSHRQTANGQIRNAVVVEVCQPIVAGRFHLDSVNQLRRDKISVALTEVIIRVVTRIAEQHHVMRFERPGCLRRCQKIMYRGRRVQSKAELVEEILHVNHINCHALTMTILRQTLCTGEKVMRRNDYVVRAICIRRPGRWLVSLD